MGRCKPWENDQSLKPISRTTLHNDKIILEVGWRRRRLTWEIIETRYQDTTVPLEERG